MMNFAKRMEKLAKRKNDRIQFLRKNKIQTTIYFASFIMIFVGAIYSGRQYNFTFISFWTAVLIGTIPGGISALILIRKFKFGAAFIISNALLCGIFFLINGYSTNRVITLKQPITEKIVGGRTGPYVTVQFDGIDKTISVNIDPNSAQFKHALYLNLTVKKGTFGYYIIEDRKLE